MRLSVACLLVALPFTPITAAAPPSGAQQGRQVANKACVQHQPRLAQSGQVRVVKHPGEFPPADLHHAVVRRLDNCPIPAIVRRNVGR